MSGRLELTGESRALLELGRVLRAGAYRFTAITPATHRIVNARPDHREARDLAGVFGWSRAFRPSLLPTAMVELLRAAGALVAVDGELCRSAVRFATLGDDLLVHDAFPTDAADAVFFGPDTYRFAAALARARPAQRAVDVGCGSGAGGLSLRARVAELVLADINPRALAFAAVNAALAGRAVELAQGDLYGAVAGDLDLIVANPPYLADAVARVYRDGGGELGSGLSARIVAEGLPRLRVGGQLILYSGAPIRDGVDLLWRQLAPLVADHHAEYEEIDPDVFGEELAEPAYGAVDRIAVVCLDVTKR